MGMIIKRKTATGYVFEREDGSTIELTFSDVRNISTLLMFERLRSDIHYKAEELDGDLIALGSLDMSPDEFENEVFECLKGFADYDNPYPSEEYIEEVIIDTARDYGIVIDDDEEEDD